MPRIKVQRPATPAPSSATALSSTSLDDLHNADCRTMLKLVDELQACGLGSIMALPRLVVCGDQSSGKSSVLEAITEVPFPRNENLCTRFATEIVMRTDATPSIRTRIIADGKLPAADQTRLTTFNRTITNFDDFARLIDEATEHMGLSPAVAKGKKTKAIDAKKAKAFSRNVLSIEISGPDRLPLTVVDLPGLIHTETAVQTTKDKELIHQLVGDYLKEDRTIVLAVAAASTDLASNEIFSKCRKVDPKGARTLGIITKMDRLPPGSKAEKTWLNVANNGDIALQLGWYLLKNRADEEVLVSFAERNKSEAEFFDQGSYKDFPKSNKGIASLRSRIADLVYEDGKARLPKIREEATKKLAEVNASLLRLGEERSSLAEQKSTLMTVGVEYHNIVANAMAGHYEHQFFRTPAKNDAVESVKFLRAATTELQKDFARQMLKYGNTYIIPQTSETVGTNSANLQGLESVQPFDSIKGRQQKKTRADAVKWASDLHIKTQGRELPGNFSSVLVTHLFHEQSQNWGRIAEEHIARVEQLCSELVLATVNHVAPKELANNIFERVEVVLDHRFHNSHRELNRLLADRQDPVSIYDPSYAANVQAMLDLKIHAQMEARRREIEEHELTHPRGSSVLQSPAGAVVQDSTVITASKALDQLVALYNHQLQTFTANVTQQVVERHLLNDLANTTFSPTIVHALSEQEVSDLTKEPVEVTNERNSLRQRKEILEKSRQAFLKVLHPRAVSMEGDGGEVDDGQEGPRRLRRRVLE